VNIVQVNRMATFGSGCFWCTQAVFAQLRGVATTTCGYSGGTTPDPTYDQVCHGDTGHAEVVQIRYDPAEISYRDLLEIFFQTHDPTSENRQGNDVGPQYRSVIFHHDGVQRQLASEVIRQLQESELFEKPIVTQLVPLEKFYPAELEHQYFYAKYPSHPYCVGIVRGKVDKCREFFPELVEQ